MTSIIPILLLLILAVNFMYISRILKKRRNDIEDIELGYWSKSWSNHKNPIMLSFDDENGLSLTIWITE